MSPLLTLTAVAVCVAMLSSCATATIDNAVEREALATADQQPLPAPTQPDALASAQPALPSAALARPIKTGQYPNINVLPVGETAQFTPSDEAATRAFLDDAKAGQQAQGESTTAYQERLRRLRLLAKNHANDTINQIEAK